MTVTLIQHNGGMATATRKPLEEVKADYEANGYKVKNNLNTHIKDGKYAFGGYEMTVEADGIFAEDNVLISEQNI